MLYNIEWIDVAINLRGRSKHSKYGMANMPLIMTAENEEVEDGYVHDIYVTCVSYDRHLHDDLSTEDLIGMLIDEAIRNEEHLREYKTDRGLMNFFERVVQGKELKEYDALIRG